MKVHFYISVNFSNRKSILICSSSKFIHTDQVTTLATQTTMTSLSSLSTLTSVHPDPDSKEFKILAQARWLELSRMTGCVPRCSVHSFSFVEKTSSQANWGRNWCISSKSKLTSPLSSSSLSPASSSVSRSPSSSLSPLSPSSALSPLSSLLRSSFRRSAAFYLDVKTSSYTFQNEFYACEWSSASAQHHMSNPTPRIPLFVRPSVTEKDRIVLANACTMRTSSPMYDA